MAFGCHLDGIGAIIKLVLTLRSSIQGFLLEDRTTTFLKLCETFDTKHGIKVGCVGMKGDDYNCNLCHRGSTLASYESIHRFIRGG